MEDSVIIAGVKIDKEHFPILYDWAKTHPETLEKQLKGLAVATKSDDLQSVAIIFENDLEHDQASN